MAGQLGAPGLSGKVLCRLAPQEPFLPLPRNLAVHRGEEMTLGQVWSLNRFVKRNEDPGREGTSKVGENREEERETLKKTQNGPEEDFCLYSGLLPLNEAARTSRGPGTPHSVSMFLWASTTSPLPVLLTLGSSGCVTSPRAPFWLRASAFTISPATGVGDLM